MYTYLFYPHHRYIQCGYLISLHNREGFALEGGGIRGFGYTLAGALTREPSDLVVQPAEHPVLLVEPAYHRFTPQDKNALQKEMVYSYITSIYHLPFSLSISIFLFILFYSILFFLFFSQFGQLRVPYLCFMRPEILALHAFQR